MIRSDNKKNDGTTTCIDLHQKNVVFFYCFASGGSASTEFYSSAEKRRTNVNINLPEVGGRGARL